MSDRAEVKAAWHQKHKVRRLAAQKQARASKPKKEPKVALYTRLLPGIRVDDEMYEHIKTLAKRKNLSISEMVRHLIEWGCEDIY